MLTPPKAAPGSALLFRRGAAEGAVGAGELGGGRGAAAGDLAGAIRRRVHEHPRRKRAVERRAARIAYDYAELPAARMPEPRGRELNHRETETPRHGQNCRTARNSARLRR